jgi:hypothetical protein
MLYDCCWMYDWYMSVLVVDLWYADVGTALCYQWHDNVSFCMPLTSENARISCRTIGMLSKWLSIKSIVWRSWTASLVGSLLPVVSPTLRSTNSIADTWYWAVIGSMFWSQGWPMNEWWLQGGSEVDKRWCYLLLILFASIACCWLLHIVRSWNAGWLLRLALLTFLGRRRLAGLRSFSTLNGPLLFAGRNLESACYFLGKCRPSKWHDHFTKEALGFQEVFILLIEKKIFRSKFGLTVLDCRKFFWL